MDLIQQLNGDMSTLVDALYPSLVQIHNGHQGHGAGTIWHEAGLVITNAHVIAGRGRGGLYVTLPDGRRLRAKVLARDADRDLAALEIDAGELATIELGNARRLRSGDWVLALGHPWGVAGAVTAGNVSATGAPPEMRWAGGDLIQVSLQLRPGHSGGPLVDAGGRLVGINMMIAGPDVGLAIPVHTAKDFLRGHLGSAGK